LPDASLNEEEVSLGTILGKCSQPHWGTDCAGEKLFIQSFSLIALGLILELLEHFEVMPLS